MEAYFPQELLRELRRLDANANAEGNDNNNNNNTTTTNDNTNDNGNGNDDNDNDNTGQEPGTPDSPGDDTINNTNDNAATPAATPTGAPPQGVRFDVVHSIKYAPWSPRPGDERAESQVVGVCGTLREANELAMREVYEKYGELAHAGRMVGFHPPNPDWIRKAGDGTWPNTWKLEDGRLSFTVVNSKLRYTLKGKIYIVKW